MVLAFRKEKGRAKGNHQGRGSLRSLLSCPVDTATDSNTGCICPDTFTMIDTETMDASPQSEDDDAAAGEVISIVCCHTVRMQEKLDV